MATSAQLVLEVRAHAAKLIAGNAADRRAIDGVLMKIDAVNCLAGLAVSIGGLVAAGARGTEMTGREALLWLAESRASAAGNMATTSIPAPDAPKRDFRLYVRHALGPWNPSYWASVYAAVSSGDLDTCLYGAEAVTRQANLTVRDQAERDIARLGQRVARAKGQLGQPLYRARNYGASAGPVSTKR